MSATYNVVLHIDVLKVSVFDLSLIKWIYTEAQLDAVDWQVELIHNFSYTTNFFIRVFVLSIAFLNCVYLHSFYYAKWYRKFRDNSNFGKNMGRFLVGGGVLN